MQLLIWSKDSGMFILCYFYILGLLNIFTYLQSIRFRIIFKQYLIFKKLFAKRLLTYFLDISCNENFLCKSVFSVQLNVVFQRHVDYSSERSSVI